MTLRYMTYIMKTWPLPTAYPMLPIYIESDFVRPTRKMDLKVIYWAFKGHLLGIYLVSIGP